MADAAIPTPDQPEPMRAPRSGPGPEPVPGSEGVKVRKPSPELLKQLRAQWESLRRRVQGPAQEAGRKMAHEFRTNADYVKHRARDYHERQPLQVLGVAAAAGFVLGLMLGFWKR